MTRIVTEQDFRMPEYRDAVAADYEFRDDGALVRKDRWEMGMRAIMSVLDMSEIDDVVQRVKILAQGSEWVEWAGGECPVDGDIEVEVRLRDNAVRQEHAGAFAWRYYDECDDIIAYRIV